MEMMSFDKMSQEVWNTTDINKKKQLLFVMVKSFKFKGKNQLNIVRFKLDIEKQTTGSALDKIAANLALNITDKVIKL